MAGDSGIVSVTISLSIGESSIFLIAADRAGGMQAAKAIVLLAGWAITGAVGCDRRRGRARSLRRHAGRGRTIVDAADRAAVCSSRRRCARVSGPMDSLLR